MKIVLVFILMSLLFVSCSEQLINETPEDFGKSVISAINARDFDKFKENIINLEDFKELIEKSEFPDNSDREKVMSTLNQRLEGLLNENRIEFEGVNFEPLKYSECHYTLSLDGEVEFLKDYYIVVQTGNTTKEIGFLRLVKTKNGWKSLGSFKVK